MMRRPLLGAAALATALVAAACAASTATTTTTTTSAPTTTTTTTAPTTTTTSPAQTVTSEDGRLSLDVPPGHPDVTIADAAGPTAPGVEVVAAWELGPSGLEFDPPVQATIELDRDDGLELFWLLVEGDGAWTISPDVEIEGTVMRTQISHFSRAVLVRGATLRTWPADLGDIRVGSEAEFAVTTSTPGGETILVDTGVFIDVTGPATARRLPVLGGDGLPIPMGLECDDTGPVGTQVWLSVEGSSSANGWDGALAALFGGVEAGLGGLVIDAMNSFTVRVDGPGPIALCIPAWTILDDLDSPLATLSDRTGIDTTDRLACETLTGTGIAPSDCTPDTSVEGLEAVRGTCGTAEVGCTALVIETETGRRPGPDAVWEEVQLELAGADGSTTVCWDRVLQGSRSAGCQTLDTDGNETPPPVLPLSGDGWMGIVGCPGDGADGTAIADLGLQDAATAGYLAEGGCSVADTPLLQSIWLFFAGDTGESVRIDLAGEGLEVADGVWTVEIQPTGFEGP